jgi:hypothetical protein
VLLRQEFDERLRHRQAPGVGHWDAVLRPGTLAENRTAGQAPRVGVYSAALRISAGGGPATDAYVGRGPTTKGFFDRLTTIRT